MQNEYRFQSRWLVQATPEEVSRILEEPLDLPRWWPAVYLNVRKDHEVYHLYTQGWLPYRLRWSFRVTESRAPHGFKLEAWGDLEGRGDWQIRPLSEGGCEVLYDWHVLANKPILRWLSPVLKPLFAANHRWAMQRGEESLKLELLRRRGESLELPPGPVSWTVSGLLLGLGLLLWALAKRLGGRREPLRSSGGPYSG